MQGFGAILSLNVRVCTVGGGLRIFGVWDLRALRALEVVGFTV